MARNSIELYDGGLEKALRRAMRKNKLLATKAVVECAVDLAEKSSRLAPIDMGDLRNDCKAIVNGVTVYENQAPTGVRPTPTSKHEASVEYSLVYARRQHEELTYRHPRGGQAKYLEEPFLANADRYAKHIQKAVMKSFE
jgi:hypothetical protein